MFGEVCISFVDKIELSKYTLLRIGRVQRKLFQDMKLIKEMF